MDVHTLFAGTALASELPAVLAAFLASTVEFVEALTIVLAVGIVRGWRSAFIGVGLSMLLLVALVVFFGPLLDAIPLHTLQLAIGVLLLLFGMRWLRKAILRAVGVIAKHDEDAAFIEEEQMLKAAGPIPTQRTDVIAVITAFKAVVLEGVEVVFIVIAVGATGGQLIPASIGAALAGLFVILLGIALHRPLARVPENALKLTVGILLSSFGVFWVGEGLGFYWPAEDLSILGIAFIFLVASFALVTLARPIVRKKISI
jgi:Ca2+/H+ antiporter, TMEM165/GDT1 family